MLGRGMGAAGGGGEKGEEKERHQCMREIPDLNKKPWLTPTKDYLNFKSKPHLKSSNPPRSKKLSMDSLEG